MKFILTLIAIFTISSCSEDNIADHSNTEQAIENKKVTIATTLLDAQMDSLKKANHVESALQQAVEDRELEMRDRGI